MFENSYEKVQVMSYFMKEDVILSLHKVSRDRTTALSTLFYIVLEMLASIVSQEKKEIT